jgi:hypothetical protein
VIISQTNAAGTVKTFLPSTDVNGNFGVVGLPLGAFTVNAQDPNSGITATSAVNIVDVTQPVVLNIVLKSGVVTGTVRDNSGNPIAFAPVALSSNSIAFDLFSSTNAQGVYQFNRVALGPFLVQAFSPSQGTLSTVTGAVLSDGQTVTLDVTMPATNSVFGTVFATDGTTPMANATVGLMNLDSFGPEGDFQVQSLTDSSGNYQFGSVQLGTVQVWSVDPSNRNSAGIATAPLTASQPLNLNVVLGNAFTFFTPFFEFFNLDGGDSFRYGVSCNGELSSGGIPSGQVSNPYSGAYVLHVNDRQFPCLNAGAVDTGGRQISLGYVTLNNLHVTRKVYSPATGGFARYLDELTNTGADPITTSVTVSGTLNSFFNTRVVVAPSQTNSTYAITDPSGFCCGPLLAHVFSGASPPAPVTATQFVSGDGNIFYRWDNVTLQPGQTVIFMHFTVQRVASDLTGTQAEATSLVNLSDTNALTGMSAAEKAEVINFHIQ